MKKINFINNQAPALNSINLNQLQDNVEYAINENTDLINKTDNKHNYSTEEQVIGTWIDGKPLYRKTIKIENVTASSHVDLTSLNIENLCANKIRGNETQYGIIFGNFCWNNGSKAFFTQYSPFGNDSNLYYNLSNVSFSYLEFTIEYTKTTDEV